MSRQARANKKLRNSQSKQFDQFITINGQGFVAAVDQFTPVFDGVAVEVIEVELLKSLAPFNLAIGNTVDVGNKPRTIRSIAGDEDYYLITLNI